ncbi:MAG: DNA mismatch endonuclease Vsr [Nitrospirae bacterium]|nr:DNA mismatch endonuclease Vsr [Nitrospirota bacterium]
MQTTSRSDKPVRRHKGDIMSPEKRSAVMSRIRGRDTGPERMIGAALEGLGLHWDSHARDLPGRPDFVFRDSKVVVFVDGDFWHGWRFPVWRDKLLLKWEEKIDQNRRRDRRNHRKLRRLGWRVVRIWEHQIDRDLERCIGRIAEAIGPGSAGERVAEFRTGKREKDH